MEPQKSGRKHIAIVNSSSFGTHFPACLEELRGIGHVQELTVNPQIDGKALAQKLRGTHYVIASVTPRFSADCLNELEVLQLIARHGIGCDNVDLKAATETGVIVTRVPGESERNAVAELALALIMACLRSLLQAHQAVHSDCWEERSSFLGPELSRSTVGIIGFGNIGGRVGEMIRAGFNSEVLAYDPNVSNSRIQEFGVQSTSLNRLLSLSDVITLHASLNEDNYHFLGRREFGEMQNGVVLVNTARGELIETDAFFQALQSGKIGAAGLDVFEEEPLSLKSPLRELRNVILTPHIGSYTNYSLQRMDRKMVQDVQSVAVGAPPSEVVNPEVLQTENRAGIYS